MQAKKQKKNKVLVNYSNSGFWKVVIVRVIDHSHLAIKGVSNNFDYKVAVPLFWESI